MLLVKVISTPYPPRKEPPENVMRGPGLLLQSYAEKSAEMATGIGRLVLLMWGNDDDDAANDGDVMGALDDPSVHAPTRKSAPSRAAALRSVPVHMVASLSLKVVADYDDVAGPSDWHRTPGPACVGARGIPGEVGAQLHIVHASGCGTRTTGPWHIGNHGIFGQTRGRYRESLRSVFTYLSFTPAGRTPSRAHAGRPRGRAPACQVAVAPGALRRPARVSPTTRCGAVSAIAWRDPACQRAGAPGGLRPPARRRPP